MTWVPKILAVVMMAMTLCAGSYLAGSTAVRKEWDLERARQEAVAERERQENAANLAALKNKYQEEIEHAKSKAGRDAVARWLREHGLLPDGSPLHTGKRDSGQADISKGTDEAACESRFAERIKEFAGRCAEDARRVAMCAEWASREGLPVE